METPTTDQDTTKKYAIETTISVVEPPELEGDSTKAEKFKPDAHFWLAFSPLTVLVVMVALDGTSLSVALPVSPRPLTILSTLLTFGRKSDHFSQITRHRH